MERDVRLRLKDKEAKINVRNYLFRQKEETAQSRIRTMDLIITNDVL
jgi:hypothetical protein